MKKSKKIITGIAAITLVAALGIGGTLAYLTDSEKVTNTFSVADLDITLTEPEWDDTTDGKDMEPGDTVKKDPTVNAVKGDSYVRVIMTIKDKDGNVIKSGGDTVGEGADAKDRLALILDTIRYANPALAEGTPYSLEQLKSVARVNADFTLKSGADGVYTYTYNNILKKDDSATLFSNIVIPTDWNRARLSLLGEYQIEIYAQAIQTSNFNSADEAFAALDTEIAAGTLDEDYGATGKVDVTP